MKEYALKIGRDQSLVGILTENGTGVAPKENNSTGVLLLNAGLIHHIGPNRIYVKMARRLAAKGFVVMRFDFSGIGDSGPRRDKLPATESIIDETRQVMDYLESHKGIRRFYFIGLCSGAGAAIQASVVDKRVKNCVLINPPLPKTRLTELMDRSRYYSNHALYNPQSWFRFFLLKSSYRDALLAFCLEIKKKLRPNSFGNSEPPEVILTLKKLFRDLRKQDIQLLLLYSQSDLGDTYFQRVLGDEYRSMKKSGLLEIERLKNADHLIKPLACQEQLLDIVTKYLTEKRSDNMIR
jgi:pimeloyl-ACP methyl ester carboxylesterase